MVQIYNPYEKEFEETLDKNAYHGTGWFMTANESRNKLCNRYSWAIPDQKSLEFVAQYSPLVEIGAGTGYWAHLLRKLDADIIAYDNKVEDGENTSHYHNNPLWTEVLWGDEQYSSKHPDRTLLICWPPHGKPFANDCLKNFAGDKFIFIGEGEHAYEDDIGCCANHAFFETLNSEWEEIAQHSLAHRWDSIFDRIYAYGRR